MVRPSWHPPGVLPIPRPQGCHARRGEITPSIEGAACGVHCGPCLASLPHINSIAKREKGKMLVFGAHSQAAGDDEVKQVVKKNQLAYTITKGVNGPVQFSGIPHAFVFDTTGALIFHGHPMDKEFDNAVRKATRGATASAAQPASGLDAFKALQKK